jgi:3-hydroxyacyl-CoA dehydrogenase
MRAGAMQRSIAMLIIESGHYVLLSVINRDFRTQKKKVQKENSENTSRKDLKPLVEVA